MKRARAWIGCSGWQYKDWRGRFYPAKLPQALWLSHYAKEFDTVELNNSFYRLPPVERVAVWRDASPEGFLFAWKASRFLTHMKKLKDPVDPLHRMFTSARVLGKKLGPVLYQLPTGWAVNEARFGTFLRALPPRAVHVVEFREASWYAPAILGAMETRGVSLCLHDMPDSRPARRQVGPVVYVRFHGTESKYRGGYSGAALGAWATWLAARVEEGTTVYAYFNNDVGGHAVKDAIKLRELVSRRL